MMPAASARRALRPLSTTAAWLLAAIALTAACGPSGETTSSSAGTSGSGTGGSGAGGTGGGGAGGVLPAGDRAFGVEVNQPAGFDHGAEIDGATAIGANGISLTLPWSVLEPTAGARDLSLLKLGVEYYRSKGLTVLLSIPTVDTVALLLPDDLRAPIEAGTLALDDPSVIARVESLLDDVLAILGEEARYLVVANEVDIHMSSRPPAYRDAFAGFFAAATAKVHAVRPEIRVGLSVSFGGVADAEVQKIARGGDVVFMTYYRAGNFGGPADGAFVDHLGQMVTYAGDRPLILKELGYATGPAVGGSEEGQAAFWSDAFTAWDAHGDSVPFLMVSRLFDGVRSECEATAASYGLPGNEEFIQFLCTLGVKRVDGTPKPAWGEIANSAKARGF